MRTTAIRRFTWLALAGLICGGGMPVAYGQHLPWRGARGGWTPGEQVGAASVSGVASTLSEVAYGAAPMQTLDAWLPSSGGEHGAAAPVLLMVHGGGWTRGDKRATAVVQNKVEHWLPRGCALISINYRLVGENASVTVADEAQDVARALAFVQHHAAAWHIDPARVVLMGHSAGGNLVAQVAARTALLQATGAQAPRGVIVLDSAAYNVPDIMAGPHLGLYDVAFRGSAAQESLASPTLQLAAATPPMLLVCGSQRLHSCDQARAFAARDDSLGGRAEVYPVDMRHRDINLETGANGSLTDTIDAFMASIGMP